MYGLEKYIQENYSDCKFSEIKYRFHVGSGSIQISYASENARAILYHFVYWQPVPPGNVRLFDQFGNQMFQLQENTVGEAPANWWAPIPMIKKGTDVFITMQGVATWSISYQYLVLNKDKDHKHE